MIGINSSREIDGKEKRRKSRILLTMVSFDKVVFDLMLIENLELLKMVFGSSRPLKIRSVGILQH